MEKLIRSSSVILGILPAIWLTESFAQEPSEEALQELLCERCPFDAPVRIRRDDFVSPNATTVVTRDDMKALGILNIADMTKRDPDDVDAESTEDSETGVEAPFNLGASIEGLRRFQPESIEQAEADRASADAPADEGTGEQ